MLYCDNGNRSYETCQRLSAMGIDCRFMVGGLQKWFAETQAVRREKGDEPGGFPRHAALSKQGCSA